MVGRALLLVSVMALTAGCAEGDSQPDLAPAAAPSDTSAPTSSPTGGEVETLPLEYVTVAELALPGDPDWLAADDSGVWVQRGSGELTLIDPATNEVVFASDVGEIELCQGVGASFGSGWTCLRSDVVRVDPSTRKVVARVAVRKQAQQGHLVGAFDHVWVLTGDGSTLAGIDPKTNRVAVKFELPARALDVTASADALWLPCRIDDRVLKVDPRTGEVLLDVEVANPVAVAADETEVWVGTATDSQRLDPETGEVLTHADAAAEPEGRLALDDDSLWVRNTEDFLIQVDRSSGARIRQFSADVTSGGDVMALDGDVWITAYDDQVLFRIQPY
jgi:streptogramin lyase